MNQGEKNEILFKIFLCFLKKKKIKSTILGEIKTLGFNNKHYLSLQEEIDFQRLTNNVKIQELCEKLKIEKSSPKNKADIHINKTAYSIKYMNAAPPSIINHTNRKGFVRIAKKLNLKISKLDGLMSKYWDLRNSNKITEDCGNNNPFSPFVNHKEILRPYLEYFCFLGSGSAESDFPAEKVIKFYQFNDPSTWKIYSKNETIDEIWNGLYFCMRGGKGMPKDYEKSKDKKIIEPWTQFSSGKFRGALSVRYK